MKKIDLSQEEETVLAASVGTGAPGIKVMKKIFTHYKDQLGDIRNIDLTGNLGLQTLANSKAVEALEEIEAAFFPEDFQPGIDGQPRDPKLRPYQ